jgi:hypothetical protein
MAKYSVTTTLAAVPTGNVLLANGARTLNVQVDAVAYAALQQSLAGNYASVDAVASAQDTANNAMGLALVFSLMGG